MNDQIITRQEIASDADAAARRSVQSGQLEENPYISGSTAHAEWRASFERALLKWSAPEAEGSC